jgi:hypothetical protein
MPQRLKLAESGPYFNLHLMFSQPTVPQSPGKHLNRKFMWLTMCTVAAMNETLLPQSKSVPQAASSAECSASDERYMAQIAATAEGHAGQRVGHNHQHDLNFSVDLWKILPNTTQCQCWVYGIDPLCRQLLQAYVSRCGSQVWNYPLQAVPVSCQAGNHSMNHQAREAEAGCNQAGQSRATMTD